MKPWKKLDFKKREPEFLKEMSQDAKTAYFGIKFNPELTKAEKTRMLKEWADQYDVEVNYFPRGRETYCSTISG